VHGYLETSFLPGRSFTGPTDFNTQSRRVLCPGEPLAVVDGLRPGRPHCRGPCSDVLAAGIAGSIGTVGDALDNALYESRSDCSRPRPSTDRPGPTAPRSSGRSPAACTGTTPPAYTPPSGTCPIEFDQLHRKSKTTAASPEAA
jgi:hypothetical protein